MQFCVPYGQRHRTASGRSAILPSERTAPSRPSATAIVSANSDSLVVHSGAHALNVVRRSTGPDRRHTVLA